LRNQGEATVLTVKEPRQKGSTIDDRPEAEVLVGDQGSFQQFLAALGYEPKSYFEKYRTTFRIGPDVTVVIDEYPHVPPYAEVEGPSQERVREVVYALGFTEADTASIPVSEYFKRHGLSEDEAKNLRFGRESKHG
jgi:adenylate cyclase class IV